MGESGGTLVDQIAGGNHKKHSETTGNERQDKQKGLDERRKQAQQKGRKQEKTESRIPQHFEP
jgi:hypothetical protein